MLQTRSPALAGLLVFRVERYCDCATWIFAVAALSVYSGIRSKFR